MSASRMHASLRRFGGRAAIIVATTVGLVGASLALSPAALAAGGQIGTVTVTAPGAAHQGDTITVSIPVDGSTDLYAYDLELRYDPALLDLDEASAAFPTGGHSSVAGGAGTVHLTDTRLGTSPGLSGAQNLVSVSFTVLGGVATSVTLARAPFVDSMGGSTSLPRPAVSDIALTASPVVEPSPSSAAPTGSVGSASPAPSVSAAAVETDSDPLAVTGSSFVAPLIAGAIAVALLALGTVLIIRRRREALR